VFIDTSTFLVHEEALFGLHELWLAIHVIEITHQVVGIEVVSLNGKGSGDLATLIKFILGKHLLEVLVLNDSS